MISIDHEPNGKWEFDDEVTKVFDDMLERSIPSYSDMRRLVHLLTIRCAKPNTTIIDLGCSTGGAIQKAVECLPENNFIGVEVSKPMREKAVKRFKDKDNVVIINSDIRHDPINVGDLSVSVILSVLTLHFTPIEHRLNILKKVYEALPDGGVFIFVEKVLGETAELDNLFTNIYYEIKGENGYTNEKIQKKKESLEGVLVPVTGDWNRELLKKTGFKHIDLFWRNINFAGYVAIK